MDKVSRLDKNTYVKGELSIARVYKYTSCTPGHIGVNKSNYVPFVAAFSVDEDAAVVMNGIQGLEK